MNCPMELLGLARHWGGAETEDAPSPHVGSLAISVRFTRILTRKPHRDILKGRRSKKLLRKDNKTGLLSKRNQLPTNALLPNAPS